jgi:hypothetical protein
MKTGKLRQIYEHPVIRKKPERDEVVDKYGRLLTAATMFLAHLRVTCASAQTYRQYRSQVLLFERFRAAHNGGAGLPYSQLGDNFLEDLRNFRLQRVKIGTFLGEASLWFRMFEYIQLHGWTQGLIGRPTADRSYRIALPASNQTKHFFLKGFTSLTIPKLPTHADFDIIDLNIMYLVRRDDLRERWALILKTMRLIPLRRWEVVVGMEVDQIPTRLELQRLRRKLEKAGKALGLNIPVTRAKRGGIRDAFFPLTLLEEFRDYIDLVRPKHLRPGIKCDAIFVSTKTGKALNPQSFTNLYKRATRRASRSTPREVGDYNLAKARPHLLRHRSVTDYARNYLKEGMQPDQVLLTIMDVTGIKSIEVAGHYVHIAEDELKLASQSFIDATNKLEHLAASRLVSAVREGTRSRRFRKWS